MNQVSILEALQWLEERGASNEGTKRLSDGMIGVRVSAPAPEIPYGLNKRFPYVLSLDEGQTHIDIEEFEAMKRALWLGDDPEPLKQNLAKED